MMAKFEDFITKDSKASDKITKIFDNMGKLNIIDESFGYSTLLK